MGRVLAALATQCWSDHSWKGTISIGDL